jgi:hypothetical protein
MSDQHTISINGVRYDARTGMPLGSVESPHHASSRHASVHAKGVHQAQQRSKTLNRQLVTKTKPVAKPKPVHQGASMDMKRPVTTRSPHISKFAPHPQAAHAAKPVAHDIAPVPHHAVVKAHAAAVKPKPVTHRPAHEIKHTAISEAMEKASSNPAKTHKTKSHRRILNVASASLAVLLLAGYFTYINMPSLSVRIAAAQAGIDATYPQYRPVGYSLNGPVAYKEGQVTMQFASNSGPQQFALSQSKSSWDSTTLLENYVDPESDGRYATYSDAGLTVYTYGNNAAWVNGGILYTVEGSAALSNEQVRRIATSM